ncbi:IclR family transcriptional regulator [Nonomuraea jiangxiensis]|uniref:DNA-binding transcriptional regulator, IclR family n=1 Tax=Nonomuraea jiangxiensis TaxID=633440 RepID=A0A1G8WG66_9ACTN|nr:IclR family transcriptional regulator [Nonomuraea jiangxiensis]SDJ76530.1 DNA-binding transcriptional regulator, IclR family [Nonomuraea jiangxiensis]
MPGKTVSQQEPLDPARAAAQPGSLERGIDILLALSAATHPLTLSQLCRSTGLPKSTGHRILGVLCVRQLARRVGNGYLPGELLATMAGLTHTRVPGTRRTVLPFLLYLHETTRQTVNLAVPSGLEARYVERLYGHNRVASRSDDLDRAPLHCTATGKALLAFDAGLRQGLLARGTFERATSRTITNLAALERELAQVRRNGLAYARDEYTEGVACVAVRRSPGRNVPLAETSIAPAARRRSHRPMNLPRPPGLETARRATAPPARRSTSPQAHRVKAPRAHRATSPQARRVMMPQARRVTSPQARCVMAPQVRWVTATHVRGAMAAEEAPAVVRDRAQPAPGSWAPAGPRTAPRA